MARKKVKLAFIVNDAARKASFNKRKTNLLKKVDEISTLCGIEACAIVYGPFEPQPDIWPSPLEVQNVLSKFRSLTEFEQNRNKLNQEDFLKQRISKAQEQLMKLRRENMENEMRVLLYNSIGHSRIMRETISIDESNVLCRLIDQNLKDIGRRLEAGNNNIGQSEIMSTPTQGQLQMAPPPPVAPTTTSINDELTMIVDHGHTGMTMNDADILQRQLDMDLMLIGNGDDTISFGHLHDANLQNGFWPNMLP
ncbi:agamous MADS-box protein AGL80 [Trifolium repens]|nr:agamous MADS-box protein AGL80 [Trifolium repens]